MIVALIGPTGSGKSDLAVKLAKEINGEIINCDAFQVYNSFPIATAMPSKELFAMVPHHLFSFLSSNVVYDIHAYQKDAREVLKEVISRGKNPIFVGGSGLYLRSALYDYNLNVDTSKVDMSPYLEMSNEELHNELKKIDPLEANKIPYQNRRRVLRSLSVSLALGGEKSKFISSQNQTPLWDCLFYRLSPNREELYLHLKERIEEMFQKGIVEEVMPQIKDVKEKKGVFAAIGIKEFFPYRDGEITLEEVKEEILLNTRHYVKRQETFFRHQFESKIVSSLEEILNDFRSH